MTPEEFDRLPPPLRKFVGDYMARMASIAERADQILERAGQKFAEETERDLRELTERNGA